MGNCTDVVFCSQDSYPKVAPHRCNPLVVPPSDWHPPMGGYDLRDEWGDVCDADKPTDQGECSYV